MAGVRGSSINRKRLERIVRDALQNSDVGKDAESGNGERFALEAARRAVEEAYGKGRQKAAQGNDEGQEGTPP